MTFGLTVNLLKKTLDWITISLQRCWAQLFVILPS